MAKKKDAIAAMTYAFATWTPTDAHLGNLSIVGDELLSYGHWVIAVRKREPDYNKPVIEMRKPNCWGVSVTTSRHCKTINAELETLAEAGQIYLRHVEQQTHVRRW